MYIYLIIEVMITATYIVIIMQMTFNITRRVEQRQLVLAKCLLVIAFTKTIQPMANVKSLSSCMTNDSLENYLLSFKVTIGTLYKTQLLSFLVLMSMGYRAFRMQLDRFETRLIMVISVSTYMVNSLFNIGQYITGIKQLVIGSCLLLIMFNI